MDRTDIIKKLENSAGNTTDIFYDLYTQFIEDKSETEAALAMQTIFEYPNDIGDNNDNNTTISNSLESKYKERYSDIIRGVTRIILNRNLTKEEFYKKLYCSIFDSTNEFMPQNTEEKVIALKILSENMWEVPYFELSNRIPMSQEECKQRVNKLKPKLMEIAHILHRPLLLIQKSAEIYRLEHELDDPKDQIVYIALLIRCLEYYGKKEK